MSNTTNYSLFIININSVAYKAALIFFHGIGAGHSAYESEIRYFAHKGYLVYAYDNS